MGFAITIPYIQYHHWL